MNRATAPQTAQGFIGRGSLAEDMHARGMDNNCLQNTSCPEPTAPCTLGLANELRNHVLDIATQAEQLRTQLFGPVPETKEGVQGNPACNGLDGILGDTCERAANLVGFLRTINSRLGG